MKFTKLGRSGLQVSRLCLGCMSYGSPQWRSWVLAEADSRPFFRRAVELGINFFDTADMYSAGVSEEVTGRALKEFARREEIVIATKVRFGSAEGPNRTGLSRKAIQQGCEESLRRLGVEVIDLYQIHRFDPETPIEETLDALDQLVRQGKVRYLGASSGAAWRFMEALGISSSHGWASFISMQNHYNLIYREEEREMLPLCQAKGIGVMPWSPLARGLLAGARASAADRSTPRGASDDFTRVLYGHQADEAEVIAAVRAIAAERQVSMASVALAWLLAQPTVSAPIIGATKLAHLEDAVKALELSLTAEERKRLEAPYRPHAVRGS